jgi:hypothetical protein
MNKKGRAQSLARPLPSSKTPYISFSLTIISNSSFLWYPFSNLLAPNVKTQPAFPTATTATLYGLLSDFGASSSALVWFKYRKEGDENWQKTEKETRTQTGDFSATITGLTPETTYQFQACASHPGGTNENCGDQLEFETTARPPFNFTLSCNPSQDLIPPGNNTTFTLNVENVPSEAERQTVTFSFSVRPPENGNANDITFSPTQPSCSAGNGQTSCNVTVTVSASGNATVGDYQITITGTAPNGRGGSVSKTTFYTLTVGGRCEGTIPDDLKNCTYNDECSRNGRYFECGGVCSNNGSQWCRDNNDCPGGICEKARQGECKCSKAGCFKVEQCPPFSCGTCTWKYNTWICENGTPGAGACCSASQCAVVGENCQTIATDECLNVQWGKCGPVPPVCDENEDCPPNMYCSWTREK